jgi:hypothetical protein
MMLEESDLTWSHLLFDFGKLRSVLPFAEIAPLPHGEMRVFGLYLDSILAALFAFHDAVEHSALTLHPSTST